MSLLKAYFLSFSLPSIIINHYYYYHYDYYQLIIIIIIQLKGQKPLFGSGLQRLWEFNEWYVCASEKYNSEKVLL